MRRNGRWLAALVVLLPAAVAVSFSDSWREYRDYEWRIPHHADAGQSVSYAGATWSLLEFTDDTEDLLRESPPEGTTFFVASFRFEGPDNVLEDILSCDVRLTDGERRWTAVSYGEVSWTLDEDFAVGCGDGSTVQVGFLVPAAAAPELREQGRLEISIYDHLPDYVVLER